MYKNERQLESSLYSLAHEREGRYALKSSPKLRMSYVHITHYVKPVMWLTFHEIVEKS